MGSDARSSVIDRAREVLRDYPLCDRCLGRMFARLSHGHSNKERGRSIKLVLLMELHRLILEGREDARKELEELAPHMGEVARGLYKKITGRDLEAVPCAICGGRLDEFIEDATRTAAKLLEAYDIERFVVGVRVPPSIRELEDRIKSRYGLEYGESIKAEIRREVGKRLQETGKFIVDFDNPEATVMIDYPSGAVWLQVNSLLILGRYWKKGRLISQAYWPTPDGPKYYSIEQALWGLLKLTGAERLVLHASGREDVDARMLGTGRPFVLELKSPRRRRIPLEELEDAANRGSPYVEVKFERYATRHDIEMLKIDESRKEKAYKALIVTAKRLGEEDLRGLEEYFRNRLILQRTPTRVLHRRPDILRRRRVFDTKCRQYTDRVFECVITAEGGLYIKELVSGDQGRTTPSFSEVLGAPATCVELDVLGVRLPSAAQP